MWFSHLLMCPFSIQSQFNSAKLQIVKLIKEPTIQQRIRFGFWKMVESQICQYQDIVVIMVSNRQSASIRYSLRAILLLDSKPCHFNHAILVGHTTWKLQLDSKITAVFHTLQLLGWNHPQLFPFLLTEYWALPSDQIALPITRYGYMSREEKHENIPSSKSMREFSGFSSITEKVRIGLSVNQSVTILKGKSVKNLFHMINRHLLIRFRWQSIYF